jgi:single-strand DNA-binding protein
MRSYNRVFLIGNCAAEPILSETQKGSSYLYFPIAVDKGYTNKENESREVDFHRVVMWKEPAQKLSELITKGTRLFVTGKIVNHKYENNDQTKYITEVHATQIEVLSKSKGQEKTIEKKELATA